MAKNYSTLFLFEENTVNLLKDRNECLKIGTYFTSSEITRVADIQNNTLLWLNHGESYQLPKLGWLISPYITYHPTHINLVKYFKGNLSYDFICFYIDSATERLKFMQCEKKIHVLAKNKWLKEVDDAKWVDSVINDIIANYI